jgi:hypothetical protein
LCELCVQRSTQPDRFVHVAALSWLHADSVPVQAELPPVRKQPGWLPHVAGARLKHDVGVPVQAKPHEQPGELLQAVEPPIEPHGVTVPVHGPLAPQEHPATLLHEVMLPRELQDDVVAVPRQLWIEAELQPGHPQPAPVPQAAHVE